jgi:hypothetical protein
MNRIHARAGLSGQPPRRAELRPRKPQPQAPQQPTGPVASRDSGHQPASPPEVRFALCLCASPSMIVAGWHSPDRVDHASQPRTLLLPELTLR